MSSLGVLIQNIQLAHKQASYVTIKMHKISEKSKKKKYRTLIFNELFCPEGKSVPNTNQKAYVRFNDTKQNWNRMSIKVTDSEKLKLAKVDVPMEQFRNNNNFISTVPKDYKVKIDGKEEEDTDNHIILSMRHACPQTAMHGMESCKVTVTLPDEYYMMVEPNLELSHAGYSKTGLIHNMTRENCSFDKEFLNLTINHPLNGIMATASMPIWDLVNTYSHKTDQNQEWVSILTSTGKNYHVKRRKEIVNTHDILDKDINIVYGNEIFEVKKFPLSLFVPNSKEIVDLFLDLKIISDLGSVNKQGNPLKNTDMNKYVKYDNNIIIPNEKNNKDIIKLNNVEEEKTEDDESEDLKKKAFILEAINFAAGLNKVDEADVVVYDAAQQDEVEFNMEDAIIFQASRTYKLKNFRNAVKILKRRVIGRTRRVEGRSMVLVPQKELHKKSYSSLKNNSNKSYSSLNRNCRTSSLVDVHAEAFGQSKQFQFHNKSFYQKI